MPRKKLESEFNTDLDAALKSRFPGCVIVKQDPNTSFQGVPDKLVLWGPHWALLESKRGTDSDRQPNQEHYVEKFGQMSYSAFVNPENMHEVLDGLQEAFGVSG